MLSTLVVLVALAIGVDIAARVIAQDRIASRAKASTRAQSASASISSFPFLYDILVDGSARNVAVHARGVPLGPLIVHQVDVSVHDVQIDKGELFNHRKVRVTAIASATAAVTITASDLTAATNVPVTISGNTITATVAGVQIPVTVSVTNSHVLAFNVVGRRVVNFDLARTPLLPACSMQMTTVQSALHLSCTIAPVPASLISALSSSR
ncbi:MAG TPA: LmeA family phospholipid-binding protein [Acidimicrobiales bacterium]|nr:LmeA family phospholipid-binding protein [Acidimicrobiales bacterium]